MTVSTGVTDSDDDDDSAATAADKTVTVELPWNDDDGILEDTDESSSTTANTTTCPSDDLAHSLWNCGIAGAILFRHFADNWLRDQRVLELGSGLGLLGWSAGAAVARAVTLTDHDAKAVARLQKAIPKNRQRLAATAVLYEARYLEWRDDHRESDDAQSYDVVLGSDVAYYFYLLRPLMDTIQSYLKDDGTGVVMMVGQANRQSQWDLYDNLVKGCYNQITDEHEPPWPGRTRMLLYRLRMNEWTENGEERLDSVIPIAVLLHERDEAAADFLQECHYVATVQDREGMMMSF